MYTEDYDHGYHQRQRARWLRLLQVCGTMATLPSQLTWLLVRNNNAFKRHSVNHTVLSAEAGNLYSKHSYKYSGEQQQGAICGMCHVCAPWDARQGLQ